MTTVEGPRARFAYQVPRRVTPEEARQINDASDQRYEYWHGWLYPRGYPPGSQSAMAGGTRAHSRVITRVIRVLEEHLENGWCAVLDGNVELHIDDDEYYFPDAFVSCSPTADPSATAEWDATLVVEVLSPSTETFDRTDKFDAYQRLPGIREYLLLSSRSMRADVYSKADGQWTLTTVLSDGELVLTSVGLTVPLKTLYARTGVPKSLLEAPEEE